MSQGIAAVIILAGAVLPIATTLLRRRPRRRYPGTVMVSPGIRIRAADVPRHFATGGRTRSSGSDTRRSPAPGGPAAGEHVSVRPAGNLRRPGRLRALPGTTRGRTMPAGPVTGRLSAPAWPGSPR